MTSGFGRREFVMLLGGAATAWPLAARVAMAEAGMRRIGMLSAFAASDPEAQARVAALQQGLRDLGWAEGRNLRFEFRWASSETAEMRALARELVAMKPDLIVGVTTPAVTALLAETRTIPIVFIGIVDPLGPGFISSLARPRGNATGMVNFEFSMGSKWLQTLKEIAPRVARVALVFNPNTAPFFGSFVRVIEAAAPTLATAAVATPVREEAELARTIGAFATEPNGGLIILPDAFTNNHRDAIVALAARHRLPAVYPFRYFAASGGLVSDGVDTADLYRRAASYVDLILKGANPGELPVQAPSKYEMVINLKTAQTLGLAVPPMLLARADEVIE